MPPVTAADFADTRLARIETRTDDAAPPVELWNRLMPVAPRAIAAALCDGWPDGVAAKLDYDLDAGGQLTLVTQLFKDGRRLARMGQRIELGYAEAAISIIRVEDQGQGIGRELVARMASLYEPLGVRTVKLDAELESGGYAWARFGFVPKHDTAWHYLKRAVSSRWEGLREAMPEATRAVVEAALASGDRRALWLLSDQAAQTPDGRPLGRALLAGTEWPGTLDLADPVQKSRFDAFLARPARAPAARPETRPQVRP